MPENALPLQHASAVVTATTVTGANVLGLGFGALLAAFVTRRREKSS